MREELTCTNKKTLHGTVTKGTLWRQRKTYWGTQLHSHTVQHQQITTNEKHSFIVQCDAPWSKSGPPKLSLKYCSFQWTFSLVNFEYFVGWEISFAARWTAEGVTPAVLGAQVVHQCRLLFEHLAAQLTHELKTHMWHWELIECTNLHNWVRVQAVNANIPLHVESI